jgi:hypothetical protein
MKKFVFVVFLLFLSEAALLLSGWWLPSSTKMRDGSRVIIVTDG